MIWVDRIATGRYSFVSVIVNIITLTPLQVRQFSEYVEIILISQLIRIISRFNQKLVRYCPFNGTAISTFTVPLFKNLCYNYCYIISDYTSTLQYKDPWDDLLMYYLFHGYSC